MGKLGTGYSRVLHVRLRSEYLHSLNKENTLPPDGQLAAVLLSEAK